MNTTDLKLPDLFSVNFFRIPDYQRGYAWGDPQLRDLWDDLEDIKLENGVYRPHFTGTISLQRIDPSQLKSEEQSLVSVGHNFFNVVDGQQRLTTISILLFEIIKILPFKKQKPLIEQYIYKGQRPRIYRFAYSSMSNNDLYLQKEIFENSITCSATPNVYTNNLLKAKTFFYNQLKKNYFNNTSGKYNIKQIEQLLSKIVTALYFDVKYIGNNLDVQSVFETMNNRGKPLTTLEKLKNRLLFLTSKLPTGSNIMSLSKTINDSWGHIYEWLGKNVNTMLDEDEFLSAHLTLLRIPPDYVYSEQMAEQRVFKMFCSHPENYNSSDSRNQQTIAQLEEPITYDKIYNYTVDLHNFVEYWYDTKFPDSRTEIGLITLRIQLLNGSKEMKLFLAEVLSHKGQQYLKEVKDCLKYVERIVFRNTVPGLWVFDERSFATMARLLHNGNMTLYDINNELLTRLNIPCNTQSLISGFRNLFDYQRVIGFYRWSGLKYFLFQYEESLRGNQHAHVYWEQFNETSIEHIMPRKYCTHWQNEMNAYLLGKQLSQNDEEKAKNIILNSLGNLTIIQDIKNSGLGNNPWTTKKGAYSKGCFSEIEISSETKWDPWSASSILDRGKRMLIVLCSLLGNLSLTCNQQQNDEEDLLFYDKKFV